MKNIMEENQQIRRRNGQLLMQMQEMQQQTEEMTKTRAME